MKFEDVLRNNIEGKKEHKLCEKTSGSAGHELDDVKIIYKRCRKCGKLVCVPDPDLIRRRGESGRG